MIENDPAPVTPELFEVRDAAVDAYAAFLVEPHRPPSRGGNTRAEHRHVMTIAGERYSFFALGSRQWVYRRDRVSFTYVLKRGTVRAVIKETIRTRDQNGRAVVRGIRGGKPTRRTAPARMPVSRREWNG